MKRNHNKGFTLIELISAIAILSIVGISAFTLLMFSIRSNNMIVTGTSAAQDADLLNKRLELLFENEDCFILLDDRDQQNGSKVISFYSRTKMAEDIFKDVPTGESLVWSVDGTLTIFKAEDGASSELLQSKITAFEIAMVPDTNLLSISYSIGDREFAKLFRVKLAVVEKTP